jgi:uncharacterized protein YdcH (DUF465 family)
MLLIVMPVGARAEDDVKPEQLKKMYDDALAQLKAAQDRKAELAKENDALNAKVTELQKQLAASQEQVASLKNEVAESADKTYYLRAYHAAWQRFLSNYPELTLKWKAYLGHGVFSLPSDFPEYPLFDWVDLRGDDSAKHVESPDDSQSDRIAERAGGNGSGGQ